MTGWKAKSLRRENLKRRRTPAVRMKLTLERWARGLAAAGLVIAALSPLTTWALPQGGTVSAGSATLTLPSSTSLRVDQSTERLIMDWRSFNIGANESVHFQQPSAASIALNRVAGQDPSAIYGSLSANGQLFLINPSGILFGSNSRVDVAGLTASTLNLTNQDFLAGRYSFAQVPGVPNAAVVNQGVITAGPGGYVALLGAAVRNEGAIQANLGSIALAAGKAATLDMRGDGLIEFVVTDTVSGSVAGPDGKSLAAYVSNTGTLQADGGMVTLTANAAVDVIKSVVNQEGVIRAQSMTDRNGIVVLSGGAEGIVSVSGTIDASGTQAGQTGGTIQVLGDKVGLFGGHINASGDAGGGTVLVGGDLHGQGTVQDASYTYVSPNATINADALTTGNGGKVVVWANDGTQFYGNISARGGAQGRDGGFVEVSGEHYLDFRGMVELAAPNGAAGTLLLDPGTITIVHDNGTDADTNIFQTSFSDNPLFATTPATLLDSTINRQLGGSNLKIYTNSGDITVDSINYGTVAIGPAFAPIPGPSNGNTLTLISPGNISWNAGWSYTNNGQLTLHAPSGSISGTGTLTIGGTSPLLLQASTGIGSSGTPIATSGVSDLAAMTATGGIFIIESSSGNVNITSLTNPATASAVNGLSTTTSGDISLTNSAGNITVAQPISAAGGGNVSLTSSGAVSESGAGTISGALLSTSSVGGTALNGANTVGSFNATNTTSGNVSLTNTAAPLTLTGVSQPGGNLTIMNTGAITQSGVLTVSGTSSFSAGANPITLTNAGNMLTGAVSLNNSGANNVVLTNNTATVLRTSAVGSGTLAVTSNGAITQTGALTQAASAGTATFNAGANAITLTQAGNDFTGAVSASNSGANSIQLRDANAIAVGTITAGGGVTINAGTQISPGGGGNITASGLIILTETGGVAKSTNPLLTTPSVTCTRAGGTCNAEGPFFEFVNGQTGSSISSELEDEFEAFFLNEETGRRPFRAKREELLTSGILPKNIFKSLASEIIEVVGGAKGFGERKRGEPVGVKIHDSDREGSRPEKDGLKRQDESKEKKKDKQHEKPQ